MSEAGTVLLIYLAVIVVADGFFVFLARSMLVVEPVHGWSYDTVSNHAPHAKQPAASDLAHRSHGPSVTALSGSSA
jgi:hypothetical protein